MARKPAKKDASKTQSFEQTLWATADKLRGSVESSEYKHVVLSLIFLKFISDKFNQRKQQLINEGQGDYVNMVEFYTMTNTFYLPENSRWEYIARQAGRHRGKNRHRPVHHLEKQPIPARCAAG